jgi:hypothetical protein
MAGNTITAESANAGLETIQTGNWGSAAADDCHS